MSRRLALVVVGLLGCEAAPTAPTHVFAAPHGDDEADGSEAAPLRTLRRALLTSAPRISLAAGDYPEAVEVRRAVAVLGAGPATRITGAVEVAAAGVVLGRLTLGGGLRADDAELGLDGVLVTTGGADALSLRGSVVDLAEVRVTTGTASGVLAESSTIAARRVVVSGSGQRGIEATGGRLRAEGLEVDGTTIAQVSLQRGAQLDGHAIVLQGASGTGLFVGRGARAVVDGLEVAGAARVGVLVERGAASLTSVAVGETAGIGVAVGGGQLDLRGLRLAPAGQGGLVVSTRFGEAPEVSVVGGAVRFGGGGAVLVESGRLELVDVTMGLAGPSGDVDAVVASGPRSELVARGLAIEAPSGFGVSVANGAKATVSATIAGPGVGGVFVSGGRAELALVVEAAGGSGVVAEAGAAVRLEGRIGGAAEAGVLATGSEVAIVGARIVDNAQFGLAAFGGATITVAGSTVRGSPIAAFATCGDGARIVDLGGNAADGPLEPCPGP